MEYNSLPGEVFGEDSGIPVKPDLLELQHIQSIGRVRGAYSAYPTERKGNSRLFGVVSRQPDVAGLLGHDRGCTVIISDFPKIVKVVPETLELSK